MIWITVIELKIIVIIMYYYKECLLCTALQQETFKPAGVVFIYYYAFYS